jgi:maltose-binding protein MalE
MRHLAFLLATAALSITAAACSKPAPAPATPPQAVAGHAEPAVAAAAAVSPTTAAGLPPEGRRSVTLWHAYRDAEREAIDKLAQHWNQQQPAIRLEVLAVPSDALIDKYQVAVQGGNGPDLVIFAHDKIGVWARDGLIQPLGAFASPERLRRFLPQTVKPLVFDKAIYGLPLAFKSLVLFYNRQMVTQPPTTWNQLVEVAKGFAKADPKGEDDRFGVAWEASNLYFHAPFLLGSGGQVLDEAGQPRIDTAEAAKAIEVVRAAYAAKIMPQGAVSGFVLTALFNDGKLPFVLQGPWFIGEIDKAVQWAVAPLPELAPRQPLRPFLGSEAVMLSAKSTDREAALRIIDYLTSDEAALTRIEVGRQMVANVKVWEMPRWQSDPVAKVFRAQADSAVPMPNGAEMAALWNPYNTALQKAIYGETPATTALAEAQQRAAAELAKMKR